MRTDCGVMYVSYFCYFFCCYSGLPLVSTNSEVSIKISWLESTRFNSRRLVLCTTSELNRAVSCGHAAVSYRRTTCGGLTLEQFAVQVLNAELQSAQTPKLSLWVSQSGVQVRRELQTLDLTNGCTSPQGRKNSSVLCRITGVWPGLCQVSSQSESSAQPANRTGAAKHL